eukprot:scaffold83887_cov32-Prasinocladus_malaysianus.AAC.1
MLLATCCAFRRHLPAVCLVHAAGGQPSLRARHRRQGPQGLPDREAGGLRPGARQQRHGPGALSCCTQPFSLSHVLSHGDSLSYIIMKRDEQNTQCKSTATEEQTALKCIW